MWVVKFLTWGIKISNDDIKLDQLLLKWEADMGTKYTILVFFFSFKKCLLDIKTTYSCKINQGCPFTFSQYFYEASWPVNLLTDGKKDDFHTWLFF